MENQTTSQPRVIGFLCNWCCYAGADLCGVSRLQYPPFIRVIRVMCSGRVDPSHVLRAFEQGADGVYIGGCWLGECHYVTEGNYDVLAMTLLLKRALTYVGVDPARLRLTWVSASEGIRFAEVMRDFADTLVALGPLSDREQGADAPVRGRIRALQRLVPNIKLLSLGPLAVPARSEDGISAFFDRPQAVRLLDQLLARPLRVSLLLAQVRQCPRTTAELAAALKLSGAEVSRLTTWASRHGLVRIDEVSGCVSPGFSVAGP